MVVIVGRDHDPRGIGRTRNYAVPADTRQLNLMKRSAVDQLVHFSGSTVNNPLLLNNYNIVTIKRHLLKCYAYKCD